MRQTRWSFGPLSDHHLHFLSDTAAALPFQVSAAGFDHNMPDYVTVCPGGVRQQFLVMLTVGGHGLIENRGRAKALGLGDVFLIDCSEAHVYSSKQENWYVKWFHLDGHACGPYLDALSGGELTVFHPEGTALERLFDRVLELTLQFGTAADIELSFLVSNILQLLYESRRGQSADDGVAYAQMVQTTVEYLYAHYDEDISIDRLVRLACTSRATFYKAFKQYTGRTPHDFANEIRVGKSKTALQYTKKRVSEIAADFGFSDVNVFIRCFKQQEGMTPQQYRLRCINQVYE